MGRGKRENDSVSGFNLGRKRVEVPRRYGEGQNGRKRSRFILGSAKFKKMMKPAEKKLK